MGEGRKIAVATGTVLMMGGLVVLPCDTEAALVLEILASITFFADKIMNRPKKRPKRRFHIINLADRTEVIKDA